MKFIITSVLFVLSIGVISAQVSKAEQIKDLLSPVLNVDVSDLNADSPISSINKLAFEQSEKTIALTKENVSQALQEAKSYKHCLITVGVHTVVLLTDKNKTSMSGAWECRMPMGKGFVQKGTLNLKEDYINNIIGVPDTQRRVMFLFK